jgi:hypothetical protein
MRVVVGVNFVSSSRIDDGRRLLHRDGQYPNPAIQHGAPRVHTHIILLGRSQFIDCMYYNSYCMIRIHKFLFAVIRSPAHGSIWPCTCRRPDTVHIDSTGDEVRSLFSFIINAIAHDLLAIGPAYRVAHTSMRRFWSWSGPDWLTRNRLRMRI